MHSVQRVRSLFPWMPIPRGSVIRQKSYHIKFRNVCAPFSIDVEHIDDVENICVVFKRNGITRRKKTNTKRERENRYFNALLFHPWKYVEPYQLYNINIPEQLTFKHKLQFRILHKTSDAIFYTRNNCQRTTTNTKLDHHHHHCRRKIQTKI